MHSLPCKPMRFPLNTQAKTATRHPLLQPLLLVVIWAVLFAAAFFDVIRYFFSMWEGSSTFAHGYFVLPLALFFAWQQRHRFIGMAPIFSPTGMLLLVAAVAVGFLGQVFSVSTVQQIALVGVLIVSVIAALGWRIALALWFPLSLLIFLAPLGNELIPLFQSITADLSVIVLGITPIPVFHDGLYITIPGHVFEVAEACSGIRFFVTCVFLGYIYAGINFTRPYKRILFMLFAIALPIFANVLRVFGIIVLGHYVDIKYAKGFDHLFVGWVFFFIVTGIMILVGYWFADPGVKAEPIEANPVWHQASWHKVFFWLSLPLMVLLLSQMVSLNEYRGEIRVLRDPATQGNKYYKEPAWSPSLQNPAGTLAFPLRAQQQTLDVFIGWYNDDIPGAKLLDGSNQFYDAKKWSLVGSEPVTFEFDQATIDAQLMTIISPAGQRRYILYWYDVPGQESASKIKIKWQQGINKITRRFRGGKLVMVSGAHSTYLTKELTVDYATSDAVLKAIRSATILDHQ